MRLIFCAPLCLFLILGIFNVKALATTQDVSAGLRVKGPGAPPHLTFACCEHGIGDVFADPGPIPSLRKLHANVAIPILDFSPQRAEVVRRLNQEGIGVVAWIVLPKEQGYYLTADNEPQAAARVEAFEQWTHDQGLRWAGVGLDIEPNVAELAQLRGHPWRLFTKLLSRGLKGGRITRAREAYSALIEAIRSKGYLVQIYQMPYIAAERRAHSSIPDRLLGTVDVRGDDDYLMLYTNYTRAVGAGMIWSLGPSAQGIAIGSTDGDATPGSGTGPLDWSEFSRDLIVASHFTQQIGVYDLEGCIRQGFLPRLLAMDWNESVTIPAVSIQRAARLALIVRSVLWIGSNFPYLISGALLITVCIWWRRRSSRVA